MENLSKGINFRLANNAVDYKNTESNRVLFQ